MQINEQGFLVVQPREIISITVTAKNTAYLATFSDPIGTTWASIQGPTGIIGPPDIIEIRKFVAPTTSGAKCFVNIIFDFQSDANGDFPPGAKYDIEVEGPLSGSFVDFAVLPPPLDNRAYKFQVA